MSNVQPALSSPGANGSPPLERYRTHTVPFRAGDGMQLNLVHVQGPREPQRGPVLLVHGAGVRANIFQAPSPKTIIDALIESGYDVWLENWRASIDLPANEWTLDQAALYDHPAAVQEVARRSGSSSIQAIVHCQGSTSFSMSVVAGLVPEVTTVVSNAVSLHPVVPTWSVFKLNVLVPLARLFTNYLNPHWGVRTEGLASQFFAAMAKFTHHECDNTVCKLVSFAYGAGRPALWSHENLSASTHEWLKEEFGFVPLRFHAQMARCVEHRSLVSVEGLAGLPQDFTAQRAASDARFAFFAGANNLCFLPLSQQRSHAFLDAQRPGVHSLHIVPNYGHLDMFMGEHAARDVFPLMLSELDKDQPARAAAG